MCVPECVPVLVCVCVNMSTGSKAQSNESQNNSLSSHARRRTGGEEWREADRGGEREREWVME